MKLREIPVKVFLQKRNDGKHSNEMKNGKSPGNDGLTKEVYMCFFNEVCNQLIAALNESFTVGQLSTSQRQATITLIEQKAKDQRFFKELETYLTYKCRC